MEENEISATNIITPFWCKSHAILNELRVSDMVHKPPDATYSE